MEDRSGEVSSGLWAALRTARLLFLRIAPVLGVLLILYGLYLALFPLIAAIRVGLTAHDLRGFWTRFANVVRLTGSGWPFWLQQAILLAGGGLALIRQSSSLRIGTAGLAVGLLVWIWCTEQVNFGSLRGFSWRWHCWLVLALMLPLLPRAHRASQKTPSWLSRLLGFALIFFGLAAIVQLLEPLGLDILTRRGVPGTEWPARIQFWLIPFLTALLGIIVGFGIALRRSWVPAPLLFVAGMGVNIYSPGLFLERGGLPHLALYLHVGLSLLALAYLAATSRPRQRRSVSATPAPPLDMAADPEIVVPLGEGWDAKLRAVLNEGAHEPPRRPSLVVALVLAALIVLPWAILQVLIPRVPWLSPDQTFLLTMVFAGIGLGTIDPAIRLIGRRMLAARSVRAEERLAPPASSQPVLYLRAFSLDDVERPPRLRELFLGGRARDSAEQIMARRFESLGPVIAIGRPGETMPPAGAARFYSTDATWQTKVANCAAASRLVVWTTGFGVGLTWEISYLLRRVPHEKLLIWAHPPLLGLWRARREAEWKRFTDAFASSFARPLPPTLGNARYFAVAPDGTLIPLPSPQWSLSIVFNALWRGGLESARQRAAAKLAAKMKGGSAS